MKKVKCPHCSTRFTQYRDNNIICKKAECKKIQRRLRRRKPEREFNCKICKVLTWSSHQEAVLCGSKECVKENIKRHNRKSKNKSSIKNWTERHKYSKSKKVKKYTEEEMITILVERHFGKSAGDIAKLLKRNIKPLYAKVKDMIVNKENYSEVYKKAEIKIFERKEKMLRNRKIPKEEKISQWNKAIKEVFEGVA